MKISQYYRNSHCVQAKKASTVVEYAALITITVGVLLTMGFYISRGIQGKYKDSVDSLGGERVAYTIASPGGAFSSSESARSRSTSFGFSWESRKGHQLNFHSYSMADTAAIRDAVDPGPDTGNCHGQIDCQARQVNRAAEQDSGLNAAGLRQESTGTEDTGDAGLVLVGQTGQASDAKQTGAMANATSDPYFARYQQEQIDPNNPNEGEVLENLKERIPDAP